nr:hypothetical protein [Sphingomonas sp. Y57]
MKAVAAIRGAMPLTADIVVLSTLPSTPLTSLPDSRRLLIDMPAITCNQRLTGWRSVFPLGKPGPNRGHAISSDLIGAVRPKP